MKRKDIKIKYSNIINPTYAYFKLIPSSGIYNYDSSGISLIANQLFKTLSARIHFIEKQFFIESKTSIRYIIDINKKNVNFYYIIPKEYKHLAIDTIDKTWSGKCIVQEIHKESIPVLNNPTVYQAKYKYQDFFSIKSNDKDNKFLYNALSILEIMKDGDNVQLAINLLPSKINNKNWKTFCDDIYDRFKKNLPIEKNKFDIDYLINLIKSSASYAIEALLPNGLINEVENKVPGSKDDLSKLTIDKANNSENIIETQIAVLTKSDDKNYEDILAKSFCNSFRELDLDNKLVCSKVWHKHHNVSPHNNEWNINVLKSSAKELSNLITIAGSIVLKKFKSIEHISTKQGDIVPELLEGISILGQQNHVFNKIKYIYYLNESKDYRYLPIILLTSMGGGKTTWLENVAVSTMNAWKNNKNKKKKESLFCIDFIKQNELSYNIMYNIDPEDTILIDLTTLEGIKKLGLYYKEALSELNTPRDIVNFAATQGEEMMKLIDALNYGVTDVLTGHMSRYLSCAFQICFIHQNKTLKDAIDIISDYNTRHKYIDMIPEDMKDLLEYEVKGLLELDTDDLGTKYNLISGIMTRVYKLMSNPTLKDLYNAKPDEGIDLLEAIQSGKAIFVTMPDDLFKDETINVISTYLISRLFFVCQRRGILSKHKLTRCTLIIDEINITPGCLRTLDSLINKVRKYQLRVITSAHNFEQIKIIKRNLTSAGLSVILPAGSHQSNFLELENEFKHEGFYLEDLLSLKEHETLNLMHTSQGKKAFISKFPKPVKGKIEDRSDIELSEFKDIVRKRIIDAEKKAKNKNKNNISNNNNISKNKTNKSNVVNLPKKQPITSANIETKTKKENTIANYHSNIKDLNDKEFNNLFDSEIFDVPEQDDKDIYNL